MIVVLKENQSRTKVSKEERQARKRAYLMGLKHSLSFSRSDIEFILSFREGKSKKEAENG